MADWQTDWPNWSQATGIREDSSLKALLHASWWRQSCREKIITNVIVTAYPPSGFWPEHTAMYVHAPHTSSWRSIMMTMTAKQQQTSTYEAAWKLMPTTTAKKNNDCTALLKHKQKQTTVQRVKTTQTNVLLCCLAAPCKVLMTYSYLNYTKAHYYYSLV